MQVFLTKYALTQGILEVEAEATTGLDVIRVKMGGYSNYYHKNDWHLTREEALLRAEQMRQTRIASLKKSIAKLEKLVIT